MPVNRHLEIESANIKAIGYDLATSTLEVIFKTTPSEVYRYSNVPARTYLELMNAESVGSYFMKSVRPVFKHFEKVEAPTLTKATKQKRRK